MKMLYTRKHQLFFKFKYPHILETPKEVSVLLAAHERPILP
jgi:hypothetical protein